MFDFVPTPIDAAEVAFAERLTAHLGRPASDPPVVIGEGSNNWVYRSGSRHGPIALKLGKPHRLDVVAGEYRKETWCAAAARAVGVMTPEIFGPGEFEGRPYLIQGFCEGRAVREDEDPVPYWEAMGRMARSINGIAVSGWGYGLAGDGVFGESWKLHLAYNLACLTPDDPLIELGVLTGATMPQWRKQLERLAAFEVRMGLCHGDFALWNLVIDGGGQVNLVDWGCARAAPAPFQEFVEVSREGRTSAAALEAFAAGYGWTAGVLTEKRSLIATFAALREIDTLRWALEHFPSSTPERVRWAKAAFEALLAAN